MSKWQTVIGLEIHAQLLTESKLFSADSARFSAEENINIHPISLGFPGVLPALNLRAVEYAIQVGLALQCSINKTSLFARKNYFYPDLPKGYQISQYEKPVCEKGVLEFECEGEKKKVRIHRVHIEEDAGRSRHQGECSLVNFNRAGHPLVEIVSEPDLRSPKEAGEMVRSLRRILRYLKVCDGNLEQGSLRCDCNVSVHKKEDTKPGIRSEIKNLNSFKFIEKAIEYEAQRQIHVLENGGQVVQETRLYDSGKNKTFSLRSKEEASDYRYFPEPDLPPLEVSEEWINQQKQNLPELFLEKTKRFQEQYGLNTKESFLIAEEKERADYFEQTVKTGKSAGLCANWLVNEVLARLNEEKKMITQSPVSPKNLGEMIQMIDKKQISGKMAKKVFAEMWNTGEEPSIIVKKLGLKKITDEKALLNIIEPLLKKYSKQVQDYQNGKQKIFGFFVGESMKQSQGQADPEILNRLLKQKLKK